MLPINAKDKCCMENCYIPARYVELAEKITNDVADVLSKRHKMTNIGKGGGLANCVNTLSLSFQIKVTLTKEQLREKLIDCEEEFLKAINANEEIRPYLKNYPFRTNEIDITIYVVDNCGREVYDPHIGVAFVKGDKIIYKTTDPENTFRYKSEFVENYNDALRIIEDASSS